MSLVFSERCKRNKHSTSLLSNLHDCFIELSTSSIWSTSRQERHNLKFKEYKIISATQKQTPPNEKSHPSIHPSCRCRVETAGPEWFTVQELTDFCSWTASSQSTPTTETHKPLLGKGSKASAFWTTRCKIKTKITASWLMCFYLTQSTCRHI